MIPVNNSSQVNFENDIWNEFKSLTVAEKKNTIFRVLELQSLFTIKVGFTVETIDFDCIFSINICACHENNGFCIELTNPY